MTMSDELLKKTDLDTSIDAALDKATARKPEPPKADVALKRQWDADLEAELDAALEGFDAGKMYVDSPRTRFDDRGHVPQDARGQEGTPGPRQGKVICVRGKSVFIDLGAKSEGVVPVEQFVEGLPNPGDMIEVVVERFDTSEGILLLSLKGAAVDASWENLRKGLIVEARGAKTNKGGLEVEVNGIRGFIPIGQLAIGRIEDAGVYVGQKLRAVVTEANQRDRNLVLSVRDLLEQERAEQREKTWVTLEEGQVRHGIVRTIKDYGAFVDIGGVDGLLHVAEMSWVRLAEVGALLKVGQEVDVKILKIDREGRKLSLGLKQLTPSPWDRVEEKFSRGMTVKGKVTKLMDFGAFVELDPGIEGLVHVSELSPNRVRRVADIVQPGQEVEVRILKIEPEAKKISLSLRPVMTTTPLEPDEPETPDDNTPAAPKPVRKVPLKGGLGDADPDPFTKK
jgi:ribosomal protein S1